MRTRSEKFGLGGLREASNSLQFQRQLEYVIRLFVGLEGRLPKLSFQHLGPKLPASNSRGPVAGKSRHESSRHLG